MEKNLEELRRKSDGEQEQESDQREYDSSSSEEKSDESNEDTQQNRIKIDFSQLPEHACSYCGIHDPQFIARCTAKGCGRWFCNSRGKDGHASHIIMHLVKAKHKEIAMHPAGPVGETNLECYICGSKNIFLLGTVQVEGAGDDSQVIIICRLPCLGQKVFNDLKWDPMKWCALIEEKTLVKWLIHEPSDNLIRAARPINQDQISYLEQVRKTNPSYSYDDLVRDSNQAKAIQPVTLAYESGKEYRQVFLPLLELEAENDQKMKESQTQSNLNVRFEMEGKKRRAYFIFPIKEDLEDNLMSGCQLKLSSKLPGGKTWSSQGMVSRVDNNEEICLDLYRKDVPTNPANGFTVEFVWKSTTFLRMKNGLQRFWKDEESISSYLYYSLLGQQREPPVFDVEIPKTISVPNLPDLNVYQVDAVQKALQSALCLIQGPPGTGKTITSASIVYHLVKHIQKKRIDSLVMVCAPSNIVVDHLAEKIHQSGVKVVRICSKAREKISTNVEFLTLHTQVRNLDIPEYSQLQQYFQKIQDGIELTPREEKDFRKLRTRAENDILNTAQVICATCISAADPRLRLTKCKYVLIDEATQAIEPQSLLPMLRGAKQVILVGDHRQLGPVITCKQTAKAGLNKSMFERLVALGIRPIRLQVQYRMHPELTTFPSNTFYEGTLQNGVTFTDRAFEGDFPWPNINKPMFFYHGVGIEEISASGTSYLNRLETHLVERIVFFLVRAGVQPSQLGIITPYKGQCAFILNYLQKSGPLNPSVYRDIEVASVDGFQGREKDFIVISCVRSNEGQGIGFLTDPRRLNVTMTRARYGLIIIGNALVLKRDNLWNNLLNHMNDNDVLVEGTLPILQQLNIQFKPPQKYIPERKNNNMGGADDDQDSQSVYSYTKNDNLNSFENEMALNSGYRNSSFGFNMIPDYTPFQSKEKDVNLRRIENYANFIPSQNDKLFYFEENSQRKNTQQEKSKEIDKIGSFIPMQSKGAGLFH